MSYQELKEQKKEDYDLIGNGEEYGEEYGTGNERRNEVTTRKKRKTIARK